jgi:hypothetical protein
MADSQKEEKQFCCGYVLVYLISIGVAKEETYSAVRGAVPPLGFGEGRDPEEGEGGCGLHGEDGF